MSLGACVVDAPLLRSAKAEWLAVDEDTRAQVLLGLLEAALGASAPGTGAPSPHAARTAGHTLVFANSVDSVDAIGRLLTARGVPCSVFHKDVPAQERALTILRFQGAGPKAGAAAGAGAGTGAGARSTEAGTPAGEDGGVGSEWGVLVCTDAASRGVDIPNVAHVIQVLPRACPGCPILLLIPAALVVAPTRTAPCCVNLFAEAMF